MPGPPERLTARAIAYPDATPDDYEPRASGPREPPEHVPRLMSQHQDATAAQRAAAHIWADLESPGLGDPHTIGRFKGSLSGLPHRPYPWMDAHPADIAYFDLPGVAQQWCASYRSPRAWKTSFERPR